MKRVLLAVTCLLTAVFLCACGKDAVPERYCDSLDEAESLIGFKLTAPESWNGSTTKTFRVGGRTLEIMYFSGKVLEGKLSKSEGGEDITAYDYGYTGSIQVSDGGVTYTLQGNNAEETVCLATWTKGKYSYFLLDSAGKTPEEMVAFCKEIQ